MYTADSLLANLIQPYSGYLIIFLFVYAACLKETLSCADGVKETTTTYSILLPVMYICILSGSLHAYR